MSKQSINSLSCEFSYELISVLPYAYNLYLKGQLDKTISGYDTKCFYFFSPDHTETKVERSWDSVLELQKKNFPNINIHRKELDWEFFSPPPLKEHYLDKSISFEKETIVIFNRYNNEWGRKPINFLDYKTLDKLFNLLSQKYQIVYLNLNHDNRYFDHLPPLEFNDKTILEKYPEILTFEKLQSLYPSLTINEIQCRIFSKCSKYISSNGGQLVLSAYFGGENIIFSKETRELNPNVNSFYRWYDKFGDGQFHHINNYDDLIKLVTEKWVEEKPLINILIRTSNRPNFFKNCVDSIYKQTYKNWKIIVGVDDSKSIGYVEPEKCKIVKYNYENYVYPKKPNNPKYGVEFKYNLYVNELYHYVKNGYCLILDDDNILSKNNSLEIMTSQLENQETLVFWKVGFYNREVPSNNNFGLPPKLLDIDSAGFLFPITKKVDWEPFKRGDFRVAEKLYSIIPNKKYINDVLTKTQRNNEGGNGKRDDLNFDLSIIIPTYKNTEYIDECINSILESSENLNVELLIGIDACEETLNHIKTKEYPDFIKFYYFNENVGPYLIKNSLVNKTSSDNILFFDSDDILLKPTLTTIVKNIQKYECVKLKLQNYTNNTITKNNVNYGEGVFAINKQLFLSMNGFEPWRVAADSDFMGRLYSRRLRIYHIPEVSFYYRQHSTSLTKRSDTGMSSQLRAGYHKLSKNKKGSENPEVLHIANFTQITIDTYEIPKEFDYNNIIRREKLDSVLNPTPRKTIEKPQKKQFSEPTTTRLDELFKNTSNPARIIKTNKPQNRQELIDLKNNITKKTMNELFPKKPNYKEGKNFINVGGKFKN